LKRRDERMHGILDGDIPGGESSTIREIDAEKLSVYNEKLRDGVDGKTICQGLSV